MSQSLVRSKLTSAESQAIRVVMESYLKKRG